MQDLAFLCGVTTCGVDWYAFHVIAVAGSPSLDTIYAGFWI
jgi:hypothetical protein